MLPTHRAKRALLCTVTIAMLCAYSGQGSAQEPDHEEPAEELEQPDPALLDCGLLRTKYSELKRERENLRQEIESLGARLNYKEQALTILRERHKSLENYEEAKERLARKRAEFKSAQLTISAWRRYLDNPGRPINKEELVRLIGRPDYVKKPTLAGGFRPESWVYFRRVLMEEGTPTPWHLVVNFTDDMVSQLAASSPAEPPDQVQVTDAVEWDPAAATRAPLQ